MVRHQLLMFKFTFALLLLFGSAGILQAQSQSGLTSKSASTTSLLVDFVGGASASVGDDKTAGAGPTLGLQVWRRDRFLLAGIFTFAPSSKISGQPKDFGAFLLDPPAKGTSLYVKVGYTPEKWEVKNALLGVSFRGGVTTTTWSVTDSTTNTVQSTDGWVAYMTPTFSVSSKTIDTKGAGLDDNNEYQFGLDIGPTFRFIGGDLGQADSIRSSAMGTQSKSTWGPELTLWIRLNTFKPFLRYSYFGKLRSTNVPSLTGGQVVFGVEVVSSLFHTEKK